MTRSRRSFLHSTFGVAAFGVVAQDHRPQPNLQFGDWDEPPAFTFATGPQGNVNNLMLVGYLAKYHGKEYSNRIYLEPNYCLRDVVDAVTKLQAHAAETISFLIMNQA